VASLKKGQSKAGTQCHMGYRPGKRSASGATTGLSTRVLYPGEGKKSATSAMTMLCA
jgi:hypothetical protein